MTTLLLVPLTPLLVLVAMPLLRERGCRWVPLTALPALAVGLLAPIDGGHDIPWLLAGSRLGLDATGRVFLVATALVWGTAAWFADGYIQRKRPSFFAWWLAAQAGNFGLVLAQDAFSFYLFFALMSLASYGLVVHDRTPEARAAANIYLWLAVLGEVLIFSGLVILAHASGSYYFGEMSIGALQGPLRTTAVLSLVAGFGIKAGFPALHVWLPLAHPAAPTPASAVLSGAMIKAGLLGWLRFLEPGQVAMPMAGDLLWTGGWLAAFAAAAFGLFQTRPKVILAYSSVGKMGIMTTLVGAMLREPGLAGQALPALLLFVAFHAVTKSALFLGVGIDPAAMASTWARGIVRALCYLPPLCMAAFPFTGGALAKAAWKGGLYGTIPGEPLGWWLLLSGALTALLMIRFVRAESQMQHDVSHPPKPRAILAWLTAVGLAIAFPLYAGFLPGTEGLMKKAFSAGGIIPSLLPLLAAGVVSWGVMSLKLRRLPAAPPGDLVVPYLFLLRGLRYWGGRVVSVTDRTYSFLRAATERRAATYVRLKPFFANAEERLAQPVFFGLVYLVFIIGLTLLLFKVGAGPAS